MGKGKMDKRIIKYFLVAAVLVLAVTRFDKLLGFAGRLWGIVIPLIMGAVMALSLIHI